jgi:hypothetical protein
MSRAAVELAALRAAMQRARFARGEIGITVVNDPEDEALLAPYRLTPEQIAALPNQCIQIGSMEPPTVEEYAAYQERARRGE